MVKHPAFPAVTFAVGLALGLGLAFAVRGRVAAPAIDVPAGGAGPSGPGAKPAGLQPPAPTGTRVLIEGYRTRLLGLDPVVKGDELARICSEAAAEKQADSYFIEGMIDLVSRKASSSRGIAPADRIAWLRPLFLRRIDLGMVRLPVLEAAGDFFIEAGEFDRGVQLLEAVVQQDPADTRVMGKIASLHLARGEKDAALAALSRLIRIHPSKSEFRLARADLLYQAGDLKGAYDDYRAVENDLLRDEGTTLRYLALVEKQEPNSHAATAFPGEAARVFPASMPVRFMYALALARTGGLDAALEQFAAVEKASGPKNKVAGTQQFLVAYAQAAGRAGMADLAERLYRAALETDGDPSVKAAALNNLASILLAKGGDLDEATALANQAVAMNGTDPAFRDTLGACHLAGGRYLRAIEELERALELSPDPHPDVLAHLGDAYEKAGMHDRASGMREAALAKPPGKAAPDRQLAPGEAPGDGKAP